MEKAKKTEERWDGRGNEEEGKDHETWRERTMCSLKAKISSYFKLIFCNFYRELSFSYYLEYAS